MKRQLLLMLMLMVSLRQYAAHDGPSLRRPISASQPAWIIHIDVWNNADPQKIIDMVPKDVRPFVIFNISTSATNSVSPDGPAVYDSWLKTCAENRVWTMIQCASGAHSRMPETDTTLYAHYFRQYPNFLGFNFAEQFWDFGQNGCPAFPVRLQLFADLLKVCHDYGGYLAVSFTQAYYSASMMPMAYLKRNADWRNFIVKDKEHFLCFEKYTMSSCFFDIESQCLGAYLGGYAGQYGIRFDRCGWQEQDSRFVNAAGTIPIMEHALLTGQTMIDGPELIPIDQSQEVGVVTTPEGFTSRKWEFHPQWWNIALDAFRKILDGTVRIPSRREVIDRTKIAFQNNIAVQDVNNDNEHDPYLTPGTLYDGLYRSPIDQGGNRWPNPWLGNRWWLKSTGRYPAIPSLNALIDDDAKRLQVIKATDYNARWGQLSKKVADMNALFPEEYRGDIYAAHHENTWVTYNPYQYDETVTDTTVSGGTYGVRHYRRSTRRATGQVPFLYNTCDSVYLSYAPYSMGIMKEYADSLSFYLSNYSLTNGKEDALTTDTIIVNGVSDEPVVTWADRGRHQPTTVTVDRMGDKVRVVVSHNGPLDLHIACRGKAADRLTAWTPAVIVRPEAPPVYLDSLQVEAENADYKSVAAVRKNGYNYGHAGYQGLGFVELGTASGAMLNDTVTVAQAGDYDMVLRFDPVTESAGNFYFYVNGKRMLKVLNGTPGQWNEYHLSVTLNEGRNRVALGRTTSSANIFVDCIRIVPTVRNWTSGIAELDTPQQTVDGPWYNLSGQRVGSGYKGVVVGHGRKMVRK